MKKFTKVILGMMLAVMFGTILGNSPADASERSVGNRYDGRTVNIQSVIHSPYRVIEWDLGNPAQVIMHHNFSTWWNQQWTMAYQSNSDSYIFMTGRHSTNGRAAYLSARNARDSGGNILVGTEFTSLAAMQWRLHRLGRHEQGDVYILQNVAHGTVLDIPGSRATERTPLILYPRHGRDNQRFVLHVRNDLD